MARSSKPTTTPETMVTMVVVWSPSSSEHTPSTPTMTASSGQGPGPAPATTWQLSGPGAQQPASQLPAHSPHPCSRHTFVTFINV